MPRAIAFVGWSGAGKTTLLEKLLPRLRTDARRVGYLKTDAHGFEMDRPGKDTARLFDAGAQRIMIVSSGEIAIRYRPTARPPLEELIAHAYPDCDLVLVEGAKHSTLPMIEVRHGEPAVAGTPPHLLAVVGAERDDRALPFFSRDDIESIARFVEDWLLT
ncbi:MAG: molybdopterin-guanine dinucleotide biosynthesis protein B [Planctomycetota bacterium]